MKAVTIASLIATVASGAVWCWILQSVPEEAPHAGGLGCGDDAPELRKVCSRTAALSSTIRDEQQSETLCDLVPCAWEDTQWPDFAEAEDRSSLREILATWAAHGEIPSGLHRAFTASGSEDLGAPHAFSTVDNDQWLALFALLGEHKAASARTALASIATNARFPDDLRVSACEQLLRPSTPPALLLTTSTALTEESAPLARLSLSLLAQVGSSKDTGALHSAEQSVRRLESWASEQGLEVEWLAALGPLGCATPDTLEKYKYHPKPSVRRAVVRIAQDYFVPGVEAVLEDVIGSDPDETLQCTAVFGLRGLATPASKVALRRIADAHPTEWLQELARSSLESLGESQP